MRCPKCNRYLKIERKYDETLQDYLVGVSCCGLSHFEQQIYSDGVSYDFVHSWNEICDMYRMLKRYQRGETIGTSTYYAFCVCMKGLGLTLVPENLINELCPPMEELVDDKYWTPPEFLCDRLIRV